jgi:hypothetical protein
MPRRTQTQGVFAGTKSGSDPAQEDHTVTTATNRRLSCTERRNLRALAAAVWPVALRLADRLDPVMSPARGSVADKLRGLAAAALQTEARLTPAREFRAFARRFRCVA